MTTPTPTDLPWYITLESTPFTRVRRGSDILASFEFGADAELAVERVNGWDALTAERDQLKAALVEAVALLRDVMYGEEGDYPISDIRSLLARLDRKETTR